MKKKFLTIVFAALLLFSFQGRSEATIPTFDAVNAALNELRNSLMQSQFAQNIAVAIQSFEQLQTTYQELLRFHAGFDDIFDVIIGDPLRSIIRNGRVNAREAFIDLGWFTPRIEMLGDSTQPVAIRSALENITGTLPDSEARPYIPFEEMQVVEGFQHAQEIRNAGKETRDAIEKIRGQAKSASPKGAARLNVEATSQMVLLAQQNQEALAKLIELEATQVEQVSREEKRIERERLRYMEEFQQSVESIVRFA